MFRLRALLVLSLAALCVPALADTTTSPGSAIPGTINYIEGSAILRNQRLSPGSAGYASLKPGEVLSTGQGRAEMLLTPGTYFRLGSDSAVKMVSPNLTWTAVDLEHGQAMVEVDQIYPQNNIQIYQDGVATQLLKTGLYQFEANPAEVMVFDGKAAVRLDDNKWVIVKAHHEYSLTENAAKPRKFDTSAAQGQLYDWSSLRSQYLSQANSEIAAGYAGYPGFVPGWYWDPYGWGYTFIGAGPFFSPFGWGFYPPWYFGGGFYGGYGFHRGYGGYGFHGGGGGFHGGGGGRR